MVYQIREYSTIWYVRDYSDWSVKHVLNYNIILSVTSCKLLYERCQPHPRISCAWDDVMMVFTSTAMHPWINHYIPEHTALYTLNKGGGGINVSLNFRYVRNHIIY